MLNLKIQNKSEFLRQFLTPVSHINPEGDVTVTIEGNKASTAAIAEGGTLSVFAEYVFEEEATKKKVEFDIPAISRFARLIDCIEEEEIELVIKDNMIRYTSDTVRFKYKFADTPRTNSKSVMIRKSKNILDFKNNTQFKVGKDAFKKFIKGSSFSVETDKLYILTRDDKVIGELTDKMIPTSDSLSMPLCDGFYGDEIEGSIFEIENIKIIASTTEETALVKTNYETPDGDPIGVMVFEIANDACKILYIVSELTN